MVGVGMMGVMSSRDASAVPPARTWLTLVPFLVAVAAVAGLGGLAAAGSQSTYRALELPPYAPPSWLFGPVWSVLYLMIGVAGWLLWRHGGWDRVMWLWAVQLVLNLAWTPLFFGSGRRREALAVTALLDGAVLAEIHALKQRGDGASAALLLPYLAWNGYATALTPAVSDPPA